MSIEAKYRIEVRQGEHLSPGDIKRQSRFNLISVLAPPIRLDTEIEIVEDNCLKMINEIPDSDPPDGLRSFLLTAAQTAFPISHDVMGPQEIAKLTALVFGVEYGKNRETDRNFDRYVKNCINNPYTPGKMLIESTKSQLSPLYGYDKSRLLALWAFFKVSDGIALHMNNTETPVIEGAAKTINRLNKSGNIRLAAHLRKKADKTTDNEAGLNNEAGLERMTWKECEGLYDWLERLLMTTEETELFSAQRLNGLNPSLVNLPAFLQDLYRNFTVLFPEEYKVKNYDEDFTFEDALRTWDRFLTYYAENLEFNLELNPDLLYKEIKEMVTSMKPPKKENSDELDWHIKGLKRMEEGKKKRERTKI